MEPRKKDKFEQLIMTCVDDQCTTEEAKARLSEWLDDMGAEYTWDNHTVKSGIFYHMLFINEKDICVGYDSGLISSLNEETAETEVHYILKLSNGGYFKKFTSEGFVHPVFHPYEAKRFILEPRNEYDKKILQEVRNQLDKGGKEHSLMIVKSLIYAAE